MTRTAAAEGFIRAWLISSSMYCSWSVGAAMPPDNSSRDSRFSKRSDRRKLGRVMADLPVYRLTTRALALGRVRRSPQSLEIMARLGNFRKKLGLNGRRGWPAANYKSKSRAGMT